MSSTLASKVSLGSAHSSTTTGAKHAAAPHSAGTAVRGFGGSGKGNSTGNSTNGSGKTKGTAQGFGCGLINGKC